MKLLIAFALWFCFCFAAIANTCEWTPAHNVYTGNAKNAIMSFTDIPLDIRETLIRRANANPPQYSDVVTISKTAIIGRNTYLPDISKMHFGSSGRMCDTVSRAKWSDKQTQGAITFCESSYCVARPAICNNWSIVVIVTPNPKEAREEDTSTTEGRPANDTSERIGRSETVPFLGYGDFGYVLPGTWGDWVPLPALQAPPYYLTPVAFVDASLPPICPPIPEPSTWLLMLAVGLAIWLRVLMYRNKK